MSLHWPIFHTYQNGQICKSLRYQAVLLNSTVSYKNFIKYLTQFLNLSFIVPWIIHSHTWRSLLQKEFLPISYFFRGLCMRANPSSLCSSTQRSPQGQQTLRYVRKMRPIMYVKKKNVEIQKNQNNHPRWSWAEHSQEECFGNTHFVLKSPHECHRGNFYLF